MDYGNLLATQILTPRNIVEAMLTGPQSDRLFGLIDREVKRAVDNELSLAKPLVVTVLGGGTRYQELKRDAVQIVLDRFPDTTARSRTTPWMPSTYAPWSSRR